MAVGIALILGAYLLGSVSSAVIVCRSMGLGDPRSQGSGNPGATNVLRLHGKTAAALTLAGDVVKGVLPVLLAHAARAAEPIVALTALAAFTGHLYPVFFGFRGGKGVATLIGVLLGLYWLLGLAFIGTWLLVAALFRYSSLAALVASAAAPLYAVLLEAGTFIAAASAIMAAILYWRHRSNIRNLLAGTEDKIGTDKP